MMVLGFQIKTLIFTPSFKRNLFNYYEQENFNARRSYFNVLFLFWAKSETEGSKQGI